MGYVHVEVDKTQYSKNNNKVSGDVVFTDRNEIATNVIICDGLGSGVNANLSANYCGSRLLKLLQEGFSAREAFQKIVKTMEEARKQNLPYSVVTLVRVLNDGVTTIYNYEMPSPIYNSGYNAVELPGRSIPIKDAVIKETNCYLSPKESLFIVSDGITQAGLGKGFTYGWGIESLTEFIDAAIKEKNAEESVTQKITDMARHHWGNIPKDDCSAVEIKARQGRVVNLFTGPPSEESNDSKVVNQFLARDGLKIICGATTAKIVARETGKVLQMEDDFDSTIAPPNYELDGIDLVTEGAVTLNQVLNIWDEDRDKFEKHSPVTTLHALLNVADRVNFIVGQNLNPASNDISFTQKGILNRFTSIPLLAGKLKEDGKLVVVKYV